MFARSASFVLLALPLFASAATIRRGGIQGSCNTGTAQCCNSAAQANSASAITQGGLLGIDVGTLTGLVGFTCSPVALLPIGASCPSEPICCTGNKFEGLVAIGCSPINV